MRDVMVSYDDLMVQAVWEVFCIFFRVEKGYEDWTDEQIALSINEDDIDEFCLFIRNNLSYDKRGE